MNWHILTGEYPPQPGGVSDYTAMVAAALAGGGHGDEVHVWAPPADGPTPETPGVVVHREAGRWGPDDRKRLDEGLDAHPAPRRLLVQYTPNAWRQRGMNLGFCRWLRQRAAAGDTVWLMVHEVRYPFWLRDRPWRWLLTLAHGRMIRDALAASERVFHVSQSNGEALRRIDPRRGGASRWVPVPCTVPVVDDPAGIAAIRASVAPAGVQVVGSFGSYRWPSLGPSLEGTLVDLLAGRDDRVGLLVGQRSDRYATALRDRHPALRGRLTGTGALPGDAVSRHLQVCDLLVLPYDDGISTRRTTAMAALAHGRAVVTTTGDRTEPFWAEAGAVVLAPDTPDALTDAADALLADPSRRAALGAAARALYERRFALEHTIAALRASDAGAVEVEPGGPASYTAARK